MYKRLTEVLLHTRSSFTSACKLLDIDPEYADPELVSVFMCDNCSYWEEPAKTTTTSDGTHLCYTCDQIETLRF